MTDYKRKNRTQGVLSFLSLEKLDSFLVFKVGAFISLTTFLILFLFEPFGEVIHNFYLLGIIRTISYSIVAGGLFISGELLLLPLFLKFFSSNSRFSIFLWYFILLLVITTGIFITKNYWMNFSVFSFRDYLTMIYRVSTIAIIPSIILLVYIKYAMAKSNVPKEIVFSSNNQNIEYFRIYQDKVVAISSEENYVSVWYRDKGRIKKKLLRNSLSNIEKNLTLPFIRVHRSHIVNMSNILSVEGNSQGLILTMKESDAKLKVSRSYIFEFNKNWFEFSNPPI